MVQLVESLQTLNKEHVCCACLDVSAVTMCLNCNDMLCRPCATVHGRLTATRHHQVEDLTSLTAERLAYSRPTPCQNHSEKTSELFCPSHGATICHLCAVSKHRTCPEVTELEVKVQQLRNELDDLVAVLKSRETEIRQAIHQLDEELMLTEERRQTAIREIDEACDRLQKSVEACRTRLKKLINSASADSKVVVNIEIQKLSRWLGKVTTHQCMTDLHDRAKIITRATVTIDQKTVTRLESELCRIGALTYGDAALDNQLAYPLFHSNHGKFIVLTDDKTSAEKQKAEKHGTVVLDRPMIVNKLYEVIVENTVHSRFLYIRAGITIQHPASLTLPIDASRWKIEAVLIGDNYVIVHGKR
nr:hypothetical protein BaRGS_027380 [Batillaria attramentaria]